MASASAGFILLHAWQADAIVYRVALAAIEYYHGDQNGTTVVLRSGKSLGVSESPEAIDEMLR